MRLTGAEAVARILRHHGTRAVFAYIGTSELSLAERLIADGGTELVNARGDKEAVFMAAGAAVAGAGVPVALLHGARGLTNAAGAVGDARRNELGLLALVGLPATRSAPFLPPHGEPGLIEAVGTFAASAAEVGPIARPLPHPSSSPRCSVRSPGSGPRRSGRYSSASRRTHPRTVGCPKRL